MSPLDNSAQDERIKFGFAVTGIVIIIIFLAVLFLALSSPTNSNFAFFFSFSLASIALVSVWLTKRNLQGLSFQQGLIEKGMLNDPLSFKLTISNQARLTRPSLTLMLGRQEIKYFQLKAGSDETFSIELEHNGRGHYELNKLVLCSDYPIGFFRVSLPINLTLRTWVLPVANYEEELEQESEVQNPLSEQDLDGLRDYKSGDALNRINWKYYARTERLTVKNFEAEYLIEKTESDEVWLDWDDEQGSTENKITSLVAKANWALNKQLQLGLRLPTVKTHLGEGKVHFETCMMTLANFKCPSEELREGLRRSAFINRHYPPKPNEYA